MAVVVAVVLDSQVRTLRARRLPVAMAASVGKATSAARTRITRAAAAVRLALLVGLEVAEVLVRSTSTRFVPSMGLVVGGPVHLTVQTTRRVATASSSSDTRWSDHVRGEG
jgi:hypothetical protein